MATSARWLRYVLYTVGKVWPSIKFYIQVCVFAVTAPPPYPSLTVADNGADSANNEGYIYLATKDDDDRTAAIDSPKSHRKI